MADHPAADATAWVQAYLVRRAWLECAATDVGSPLAEFEADALLHLAGPPLMPARPTTAPPPATPATPATPKAAAAWIDELEPWVTALRRRLTGQAPGLRRDAEAVWTRRARWAWDHHARGQGWPEIAARDAQRHEDDTERWRYVKDEARRALTLGCGGSDPKVLFDHLCRLMAAYADPAEPTAPQGVISPP